MSEKEISIKEALDLAVKKHNEGKLIEAKNIYEKILAVFPDNSNALHLLGLIEYQQGNYKDAIYKIEKAIKVLPESAIYYGNLGMIYDSLGDYEASERYFEKALQLDPHYNKASSAHYNLGIFNVNKMNFREALEHYNSAIQIDKNFYDCYWNRGLLLLLLGIFKEGWEDYEFRFKKKSPTDTRHLSGSRWEGCSLEGKRILVIAEQGFGDCIQFVRYLDLIKKNGGHIILECKKELKSLFECLTSVDEFIEKGEKDITKLNYDYYIHLMSLPYLFKTNLNNIIDNTPYIKAKAELVQKFKSEMNREGFKVGIVWSGNPNQDKNDSRSIPYEKFKVLKNISGIELYSLQKGNARKEADDGIIDLSEKINDFADTAAIIENLDLVITVDTSVAHLAGAMGKETWVLLSSIPDWRWMLNRKDSPWYKSIRLFRQSKQGDWDSVFEEVTRELRKLI